jgi:hypothetical protein
MRIFEVSKGNNPLKLEDMETKTYNYCVLFGITNPVMETWYDYTESAARRKAERRAKKWNCEVRIFKELSI